MRRSIRFQLIMAVGLVCLTVLGSVCFLALRSYRRSQLALIGDQARELTETIKSSTRYAMLHNRREDVEQILVAIGRQEKITDVHILNKEGRVVYSADDGHLGVVVDKHASACKGCHETASPRESLEAHRGMRIFESDAGLLTMGIISPIYNEPSCSTADCHAHPHDQAVLGVLDVTTPLDDLQREIAAGTRRSLLMTFTATLLISVTIWVFLHHLVVRPVGELLAATRIVAAGNLQHRIVTNRDDELGALQSSFNRMTARLMETQNQLYQSNKLASIGRLAAGIAHEINNPLTGILSFSSLLSRKAPEGSEDKKDLETIVGETKRCREIVKGLLDFSRQVPPHKQRMDANEVVGRVLDILDHQLEVQGVAVDTHTHPEPLLVWIDRNQITQVLVNLIVNAADAFPESGGRVSITTRAERRDESDWVVIEVADNGCGIAAEDLDKIFEPFFTTKDKGTGLGLAVAWGIVEEHGGTLAATSEVGRGSTFSVRLPMNGQPTPDTRQGRDDARA